MLSLQAFNAFLKTLEEPPRYAIFILATTEKHKILPTILSRCQTFDFNRIKVEDAVEYLKKVAQQEGVVVEEEGLNVIAQKADGAMRDALSIFDQIVAFSGKNVSFQQVIESLNVLDYDYYFKLVDAFLNEDTKSSLLILDEILNHGFDEGNFVAGLCSHFRDLLMCKDEATLSLLEVGASIREKYLEQSRKCQVDFLVKGLEIATQCDIQFRSARNKRLHTEFALIKLSRLLTEKKKVETQVEQSASLSTEVEEKTPVAKPGNASHTQESKSAISKPGGKTLKRFSIKEFTSAKETSLKQSQQQNVVRELSESEEVDPSWNNEFTPEELQKVWYDYARSIKSENPRLFSMLTARSPRLKGKQVVVFPLQNETQEVELLKEKTPLFNYLRRELKNAGLRLEIEYVRNGTGQQKAFTAADKYKLLAEKNPVLNKLKDTLNLDLE
jgi:DNA polymerase-3 subunit gamma/tau